MKKISLFIVFFCLFLACSAAMFAQENGTIINGVKWASRNVDKPGTFADKPESPGMFYQWNRKSAWAASGNITGWDSSNPKGTVWEESNDPSPAGWRLPTLKEIEQLLDKEKVTIEFVNINGAWGNKFTDKATGNSIFLPFVGTRINAKDGTISTLGSGYWSSVQKDTEFASVLLLALNQAIKADSDRKNGLLIRCVAKR